MTESLTLVFPWKHLSDNALKFRFFVLLVATVVFCAASQVHAQETEAKPGELKQVGVLKLGQDLVPRLVAFTPDTKHLIWYGEATQGPALRRFNLKTGREEPLKIPLPVRTPGMENVAMSVDGSILAIAGYAEAAQSTRVDLWSTASQRRLKTLRVPGMIHKLYLTPNGNGLVTCRINLDERSNVENVTLSLVSTKLDKIVAKLEAKEFNTNRVHVAQGALRIVLNSEEEKGDIHLWDLKKKAYEKVYTRALPQELALSPDGLLLARSTADAQGIKVALGTVTEPDQHHVFDLVGIKGANQIGFSQDGKLLVFVAATVVKVWNVETKKLVAEATLQEEKEPFRVSFSSDGQVLAIASNQDVRLLKVTKE